MSTLVKGKTAKETIVVSVVKIMMLFFDQGEDGVAILDRVRQRMIIAAHRKFIEMIQIKTGGCH